MLDRLHEIQREEHPVIRTIVPPVFDAALNWVDAYMEYIPHYPIAAFRIDDEMANNPSFKAFIDVCSTQRLSTLTNLRLAMHSPSRLSKIGS
jgi:RHO1 GDP-GTP exchange protein 1/2